MATWPTPPTPTTRPSTTCWTGRHRWTPSPPRCRRGWPSSAAPATTRPANGSTSYRWLAAVLRGDTSAAADDAIPADSYASNPLALFHGHLTRAIAAAVFGDLVGLARHSAAAMKLLPIIRGLYPAAVVRVLRGLALAGQARSSHGSERRGLLTELDEVTHWVAARAEDAPRNFLHLLRLLEAERAWALGDFHAAALAFDTACRDAALSPAPLAPRPDRRAVGAVLPRARPRPCRLWPSRRGPPASTRPGARPPRSASWTGPTPRYEATQISERRSLHRAPANPAMGDTAAPRSRPARSTCSASCPRHRRSAPRPASSASTPAWSRCLVR